MAVEPREGDPRKLPGWLVGRFGEAPQFWVVGTDEGRRFEAGCLIHPNTDSVRPEHAIGVILRTRAPSHTGALAVVAANAVLAGAIYVRESGRSVPARLGEPFVYRPPPAPIKAVPEQVAGPPRLLGAARHAGAYYRDLRVTQPRAEGDRPAEGATPIDAPQRWTSPARFAGSYFEDDRLSTIPVRRPLPHAGVASSG
jgi:hypothetical protein